MKRTARTNFALLCLTFLLGAGCISQETPPQESPENPYAMAENQIDAYHERLLVTDSAEEETDLLSMMKVVAEEDETLVMYVSSEGQDVTVEFLGSGWSKAIQFSVMNTEHISLLQ